MREYDSHNGRIEPTGLHAHRLPTVMHTSLARPREAPPTQPLVAGPFEATHVQGRLVLYAPATARFLALGATGLRIFHAAAQGRTHAEILAMLDEPGVTLLATAGAEHLGAAIELRDAFAEQARRRADLPAIVRHETALGRLHDQRGAAAQAYRSDLRALAASWPGPALDPSLLVHLALTTFRAGHLERADARLRDLLAARQADNDAPTAQLLAMHALVAAARGDRATAAMRLAAARAQADREDDDTTSIRVALCEGDAYLRLGDPARARDALEWARATLQFMAPEQAGDTFAVHVALAECDVDDPAPVLAALRALPRALMDPDVWSYLPRLLRRVLGLAEQGWLRAPELSQALRDDLRRLVRASACRCDCEPEAARLGALLDRHDAAHSEPTQPRRDATTPRLDPLTIPGQPCEACETTHERQRADPDLHSHRHHDRVQ